MPFNNVQLSQRICRKVAICFSFLALAACAQGPAAPNHGPESAEFDQEPVEGSREKETAEYYAQQMHQLGMEVSSREIRPGRHEHSTTQHSRNTTVLTVRLSWVVHISSLTIPRLSKN